MKRGDTISFYTKSNLLRTGRIARIMDGVYYIISESGERSHIFKIPKKELVLENQKPIKPEKWVRKKKGGKYIKKPKKPDRYLQYEGKTFNNWTVLKYLGKIDGFRFAYCKCRCGVIKRVNLYTVVNSKSKSCGCLARMMRYKKREEK